jgi:lipid-A-disaccharide synthase
MPIIRRHQTYFISAGEVSGDLHGADLILELKEKLPRLSPFGIAGEAMLNAGTNPIASIDELNVMGIMEIAKKLPQLKMLESRILRRIEQFSPRFAVLIDNPGFHIRLAEQLKLRGLIVFQYVAPKLWAWGARRADAICRNFDLVMGILPFEEQFFKDRNINYEYVGSPLKDRTDKVMIKREALGIPSKMSLIACLPGSRPTEVKKILPVIANIQERVRKSIPGAVFVVPLAPGIAIESIPEFLSPKGAGSDLVNIPAGRDLAVESYEYQDLRFIRGMSLEILGAANAAIIASGTATLECALLCTPMVVVYSMNELTYQIAKRAVHLPHVSLVNLIAGKELVREFIQDFSEDDIAIELISLVTDDQKIQQVRESFEDLRDKLKGKAAGNAAKLIDEYYGRKNRQLKAW